RLPGARQVQPVVGGFLLAVGELLLPGSVPDDGQDTSTVRVRRAAGLLHHDIRDEVGELAPAVPDHAGALSGGELDVERLAAWGACCRPTATTCAGLGTSTPRRRRWWRRGACSSGRSPCCPPGRRACRDPPRRRCRTGDRRRSAGRCRTGPTSRRLPGPPRG